MIALDDIDTIIANSYKDFHAKGLDYICLQRSENLTRKVYFLDGNAARIPEVVNPHNHRYPFSTTVLAGAYVDHVYYPIIGDSPDARRYQRFNYQTPLNGGNGFTYEGEDDMVIYKSYHAERNQSILRGRNTIHTIQMKADQTVLYLEQRADEIPIGHPTQCWVPHGEPKPDTSGLYTKFTHDEIAARMKLINELIRK